MMLNKAQTLNSSKLFQVLIETSLRKKKEHADTISKKH